MTRKLTTIAGTSLAFWICVPILVMLLNAGGIDVHITYSIWATFLYLGGGLGVAVGLLYLYRQTVANILCKPTDDKTKAKEILSALAPILAMLLFGLWAAIASFAAKRPYIAFFGFNTMKDCMAVYFAYAGFILSGLVVSQSRTTTRTVAKIFLAISALLAILALMDNKVTTALMVNDYTNTFHYQAVFYNTNHYAYYLLLNILLSGYLFIYTESKVAKGCYIALYILFTATLVFNNTMGAFLAALLTLIFAIIWSFINGEKKQEKIGIIIIFAVFVATTLLVNLKTHNVVKNFTDMFFDAGILGSTIIDSTNPGDIDAIGSSRGLLWRLYWDVMTKYPILGVGPENVGTSAHNIFLQIGAYTGAVGLAIYLSIYVIGVIRLIRRRKEITPLQKASAFLVTGYLISAFFGVTMFYTAPYFYAILGVCLSATLNNLTDNKEQLT